MTDVAKSRWPTLIATWFGAGLLKPGPGTWGTLAGLPLVLGLHLLGPLYQMGFSLLLFVVGVWAVEHYQRQKGGHDRSEIVVDEVIGILITMTWLPLTWQAYVAGFFLFRLLDVLKPFPISYFDRNVKGGVGVIADDVIAGIVANILLQIVFVQTNWLGLQVAS